MASPSLKCPGCKQQFQATELPGNLAAICPHCQRVMRWFYAQNNQRYGPLLFGQLAELVQSGAVQPEDWVYQEGSERWLAAREVPALTLAPAEASHPDPLDSPTLTQYRTVNPEKPAPPPPKRKKQQSGGWASAAFG